MKKICFIGGGNHATQNLYPSLLLCDASIVGVATRNTSSAMSVISRFGLSEANAFDDYRPMLQSTDCDGVIISTGIDNQYEIVRDVIKAGKNFLVEKPLGLSEKEAQEIAQLSKQHGVFGMVAFMKRFAPAHVKLKQALDDGVIGKPLSFNGMMSVDCTKFVEDDQMMLKCAMIHYLDLMRHLFGEVFDVKGFRNSVGKDTNLCFSLKFESGVVGNLYFSGSSAWTRHKEFLTVTGQNGIAELYDFTKLSLHKNTTESAGDWRQLSERDTLYFAPCSTSSGGHKDLYMNGFVGEIQHFLDCLETKKHPISDLFDNIATMKLCEDVLLACYL